MKYLLFVPLIITVCGCLPSGKNDNSSPFMDVESYLELSLAQMEKALVLLGEDSGMPRRILPGNEGWSTSGIYTWASGFWPGLLWYAYEYSGLENWKQQAHEWTMKMEPVKNWETPDHDLGFMMYCSFGNGLRLTGNSKYIPILIETADSMLSLFNPAVGTIQSWPPHLQRYEGYHNTIIDNMMNLELLFWATKQTGDTKYREVALKHAETSAKTHIREDFSTYHVYLYDPMSGDPVKGITRQGAFDESMWARGQAWAVYGYTMVYRESGEEKFLTTAKKLAAKFLKELPENYLPFWDFSAPDIPDTEIDASAAAIVSSALLDLSQLTTNPEERKYYRDMANKILIALVECCFADGSNVAILRNSVGDKPLNREVSIPIIYADYYFIEALMRERAISNIEASTKRRE